MNEHELTCHKCLYKDLAGGMPITIFLPGHAIHPVFKTLIFMKHTVACLFDCLTALNYQAQKANLMHSIP